MNEQLSEIIKGLSAWILAQDSHSGLLVLGKWTFYLLITRPIRLPSAGRLSKNLRYWTQNIRRHIMKRFQLNFIALYTLIAIFSFMGCYTTFRTARDYDPGVPVSSDYSYEDQADQWYEEEDSFNQAEYSTLEFRPPRLVVKKTYHDYGRYVRTVKYTLYAYDPWGDPYFDYYHSGPDLYISIYLGGYPYPYFRPWFRSYYYTPAYYGWTGLCTWYDPWYGYPVYYPVYYPVLVYYPYPVNYYPHHGNQGGYAYDYRKRDWDRRNETSGRRIASRGSSNGNPATTTTEPSGRRISRRENATPRNPGNTVKTTREEPSSGRRISGRETGQDVTGNRNPSRQGNVTPRPVQGRQTRESAQSPISTPGEKRSLSAESYRTSRTPNASSQRNLSPVTIQRSPDNSPSRSIPQPALNNTQRQAGNSEPPRYQNTPQPRIESKPQITRPVPAQPPTYRQEPRETRESRPSSPVVKSSRDSGPSKTSGSQNRPSSSSSDNDNKNNSSQRSRGSR